MKGHRGIGEREHFLNKGFSSLSQTCRRGVHAFSKVPVPIESPTQLFWDDCLCIIYISKRKGSGMESDASLSGASGQCPLSLLPTVTCPFHRSCTEQGNAVSVQRSGSRYLLSGIAGESPWGSQENLFGIRSGRSRRPCPDFLPGVFILTAKVASLFVRTFSHGCFACPHRRTHLVRRRSASVTFRGAGACPSSRIRDVGHPVRGGAGPRRPQASRRVHLRDHQRQVRALPRKLRLLRPVRASPDGFARVSPL